MALGINICPLLVMVPVSILLGAFIVNLQCYQGNTSTWILPPLVRPRRKACAFFNRTARVQHGLLVQRLADALETQRQSLRLQQLGRAPSGERVCQYV